MTTEPRAGRPLVGAVGVGFLAGFLSGLWGVGGGILIVPGLVLLLAMDQRSAHGTSLAAIVPIAISGVVGYVVDGAVDWPVAATITAGAVGGSLIGIDALHRISVRWLRVAFITFLLLTAARMALTTPEVMSRGPIDVGMLLGLTLLGLASGTLAGLLGVGGGIVIVPVLVTLFLVPDAVAKGTSLIVIVPTAMAGTLRNVRYGNADLRIAATVGIAGVISAFLGAQVAIDMAPRTSSVLFGLLLVAVAVRMALVAWRDDRARRAAAAGG